eukprot:CAMPEP_0177665528 /NCGR_PEP_ID=MMETSP0447-20121125/21099_1 /TAXON_ID=0 /ORGANISM="Stygamoeba regulata, Strain BSH-02190019" /LENGTH=724 /DNA_ID=CAMNT_0019171621 /DNA_START=39 /DNA_END=2213 /DNA_ORIENTATION=+
MSDHARPPPDAGSHQYHTTTSSLNESGKYSDDDGEQLSVRTTSRRVLPYEIGSRVVPSVDVADLSVAELQALLIRMTNEPKIEKIQSRAELLMLLRRIKAPSAVEGLTPVPPGPNLRRTDISCTFRPEDRLGRGGFGAVYRAEVHGFPVACKVLNNPRLISKLRPSLRKEVEVMRIKTHPHICQLLGVCEDGGQMYIVMELMCGDLEKFLSARPELPIFRRLDIARQVASGLQWMHSIEPPVFHLDLKLENVLYDKNEVFKLTDFGLSVILDDEAEVVQSEFKAPGNVGHMPPEIIRSEPFDAAADVYAFGVLLWEIIKGYEWEREVVDQLERMNISTREGNLRHVVKRAICFRHFRPELPDSWPPSLKKLLTDCWAESPDHRPTMEEVMAALPIIEAEFAEAHMSFYLPQDRFPAAYEFWRTNFPSKIIDPVPWAEFSTKLYAFLGIPLPDGRSDAARRSYLSLRVALDAMGDPSNYAVRAPAPLPHPAGPSSGLPAAAAAAAASSSSSSSSSTASASSDVLSQGYVTFERFAKICDAFGPLVPPAAFFKRIEVHLQNRWFHPQLSQSAAQSYLLGQEDGTFVVRFSNKPRVPFTLTRVLGGRLYQTRIYRLPDGSYRLGEENGRWADRRFESLESILKCDDVIKAYSLMSYVQFQMVSPGQKLLLQPLLDTNYAPDLEPSIVDQLMGQSDSSFRYGITDQLAGLDLEESSDLAAPPPDDDRQ